MKPDQSKTHNPSDWALYGETLKKDGKFDDALEAFAAARIILLAEMGDCLSNLGKTDESAVLYEEILDFNPNDLRAMVGLGVSRLLGGRLEEAVPLFSSAVTISPDNSKALCGLGLALSGSGRKKEGLECYNRVLENEPENLTVLHDLVKLAYELNQFDEAIHRLEHYLMYHPGDTDMLFSYAGILHAACSNDKARDITERILALVPDYEGARELMEKLGHTAQKAGSIQEAQQLKAEGDYEAALLIYNLIVTKADRSHIAERGDCLANLGRFEEAASDYQDVLSEDANNIKALVGLGVTNLMLGKLVKAVTYFNKALKGEPANSQAHTGLGLVRNAQSKTTDAFGCFCRALDADPENLNALHELLKTAYAVDRLNEAEPYLVTHLMYHPTDQHILFSLAGLQYRIGKHVEAIDNMERLMIVNPAYEGAAELLALVRQACSGNELAVMAAELG